MRISTSFIGNGHLYRVDIIRDDGTACYFIKNRKPEFFKEPSETSLISLHWSEELRDETQAQEIIKLVLESI